MKKLFTLLCAIAAAVVVNASTVDVVTTPELPVTFDESWGQSFVIDETNLKAGDILTFTAEPIEAVSWTYGSQIFFKTNAWKDMPETQAIKITAARIQAHVVGRDGSGDKGQRQDARAGHRRQGNKGYAHHSGGL